MQEAIAQIVIELQLPNFVVAIAWKHGVKLEEAARVRQMWTIQDATCRMFQSEGAPTLGATVYHPEKRVQAGDGVNIEHTRCSIVEKCFFLHPTFSMKKGDKHKQPQHCQKEMVLALRPSTD